MTDWVRDIHEMHVHYGFHEKVKGFDGESLKQLLDFRRKFIKEELTELETATCADDAVDALIDICVVAIGTLDLFEVDGNFAWREVFNANMKKQVGVKKSRPNPLGLPDLIKPEGWEAPTHEGNTGTLDRAFE